MSAVRAPGGDDARHGALDDVGLAREPERVPEQHRRAEDRADRIRDALAGDVGRRAVDRLVETARSVAERRAREEPERPGEHGRFVGEDVAEHVLGDDHVERPRGA